MSPFLRAVLFAICLFCFSPLSVLAEYVFDGTFTLERKYGDPVVVKKVNFEGQSAVHYTTVDGKQGYTREFIITNLTELYRATNRTANSSREEYVERNPAISTKLYTEKLYRLDAKSREHREPKGRTPPPNPTKLLELEVAYKDVISKISGLDRIITTAGSETKDEIRAYTQSMKKLIDLRPRFDGTISVSGKAEALTQIASNSTLLAKAHLGLGEHKKAITAACRARLCTSLSLIYTVNAIFKNNNIDIEPITLPYSTCTETKNVQAPTKRNRQKSTRRFPDGIDNRCENKWGADQKMVNYCINKQRASKSVVESHQNNEIMDRCERKWGTDYSMVEYCINKQGNAKDDVRQSLKDEISHRCTTKWGTDYSMVKYCESKQRKSKRNIRSVYANNSSRAHCKRKWGTDYSMIEYCISK